MAKSLHDFWQFTLPRKALLAWCRSARAPLPNPPHPLAVKNVLIWNMDAAGDLLWCTPTISALKKGYPNARIIFICNKDYYFKGDRECLNLLRGNPNIDQLIAAGFHYFPSFRGAFLLYLKLLLKGIRQIDVAIAFGTFAATANQGRVFARLFGAAYTLSLPFSDLDSIPQFLLPINSSKSPRYWPEYFLGFPRHLGLAAAQSKIEIYPTMQEESRAQTQLFPKESSAVINTPHIVLHPFVTSYGKALKAWPEQYFIELAKLVLNQSSATIFIGGSLSERPMAEKMAEKIAPAHQSSRVIVWAGAGNLKDYYLLIRASKALVTGDTSALHIGSAAGIPTLAIFGGTPEKMIAAPETIVFTQDISCRPCFRYKSSPPYWPDCTQSENFCLTRTSPDSVFQALKKYL